jgi:hypothetical protein
LTPVIPALGEFGMTIGLYFPSLNEKFMLEPLFVSASPMTSPEPLMASARLYGKVSRNRAGIVNRGYKWLITTKISELGKGLTLKIIQKRHFAKTLGSIADNLPDIIYPVEVCTALRSGVVNRSEKPVAQWEAVVCVARIIINAHQVPCRIYAVYGGQKRSWDVNLRLGSLRDRQRHRCEYEHRENENDFARTGHRTPPEENSVKGPARLWQ